MPTFREIIIDEILAEREYQDDRWGGADHDDLHTRGEWVALMVRYLGNAATASEKRNEEGFYKNMVQLASLAVSAAEAHRRKAFVPIVTVTKEHK